MSIHLTPTEQAVKYKAKRDLISILSLISGTVLLTVSAAVLFGVWVSLLILGVIIIGLAILIGLT